MKRPAEIRNVTVDPQDFIAGVVFGIVSIVASYVGCFWLDFKGTANLVFLFSWLILLLSLRTYILSIGAYPVAALMKRFLIMIAVAITIEFLLKPFTGVPFLKYPIVSNSLLIIKWSYWLYLFYVLVQTGAEINRLSIISSLFATLSNAIYTALVFGVLLSFILLFDVIKITIRNIPSVIMILILYRAYRASVRQ